MIPRKPKDAVDDMKDRLYSRVDAPVVDAEERTPLSPSDDTPPKTWTDIKEKETQHKKPAPDLSYYNLEAETQRMRLSTKFFLGSVVFFVGAIAVAGYMFFFAGGSISQNNIDIQVVSPSLIDSGKTTSFDVLVTNRNVTPLQLVDLIIDYPQGTRDAQDQTKALPQARQSIGTIAAGQQVKRVADAVFYGQEGVQQKLAVTLEYTEPGSNAIYQKEVDTNFVVGSSPVTVTVASPTEAIAGQPFGMDVTVASNSATPIDNLVLQSIYPFGFSVSAATPKASVGDNIWHLGTLKPGAQQTIHIDGTVDGQDGDERVFRFLTGVNDNQTDTTIKVPFLTMPQTVTVRRPFVSASLAINGQTGKSISVPGSKVLNGTITWQNNLKDAVADAELVLTLDGPMLDKASVMAPSGFYQSANSTITWTKDDAPELTNIAPGASGTLNFSFSTLAPGASGAIYSNPVINLDLSVAGVRQGQGNVPQQVSSAATTQVLLSSAVALTEGALHFSGPFNNPGPMPPVVESSTAYTIVWTVTNSSNSIANGTVSATLPSYMTFIAAAPGSGITYSASNRTVTWALGDVKAGAGFSQAARSAAFQVQMLPSVSQVGSAPRLTGDASFTGIDRFAQVSVSATAQAPTTDLTNDAGFQNGMGLVAPKK